MIAQYKKLTHFWSMVPFRKSHRKCSVRKGRLGKFWKIHRKTPVPAPLYCEIFKKIFFTEHLWETAFAHFIIPENNEKFLWFSGVFSGCKMELFAINGLRFLLRISALNLNNLHENFIFCAALSVIFDDRFYSVAILWYSYIKWLWNFWKFPGKCLWGCHFSQGDTATDQLNSC